mmetsp:Transcript_28574/g.82097  ORF Transcript_28574/g.82097 Transcript_28574/m.82097 type:complete len:410 (+) Transcript_28574:2029-3258(+)
MTASFCSLAMRSSLRLMSSARSLSMPTATLSFCRSPFFTPFAFSSTRTLMMASAASSGSLNLNSPSAYFKTSFLFRKPSLSLSYLTNTFSIAAILSLASTFFLAFSAATLLAMRAKSLPLVHSVILAIIFCIESLSDSSSSFAASSPGITFLTVFRSETRMAAPSLRTMSVQTLSFSLASRAASSMAVLSFSSCGSLKSEGSSLSRSFLDAFFRPSAAPSAASTRPFISPSSACALRMASWRLRSISAFLSSSKRLASFSFSIFAFACSTPASASALICTCWEPQLMSSLPRASWSSTVSASMVSSVAALSLMITRRIPSVACCSFCLRCISSMCLTFSASWRCLNSSCCRVASSVRLCCSAILAWFAASSLTRFCSQAVRCCSSCCWRRMSSSFLSCSCWACFCAICC